MPSRNHPLLRAYLLLSSRFFPEFLTMVIDLFKQHSLAPVITSIRDQRWPSWISRFLTLPHAFPSHQLVQLAALVRIQFKDCVFSLISRFWCDLSRMRFWNAWKWCFWQRFGPLVSFSVRRPYFCAVFWNFEVLARQRSIPKINISLEEEAKAVTEWTWRVALRGAEFRPNPRGALPFPHIHP